MSVSSELYKVNVVGDGSTPSIAFNRKVFNSTDIKGFSYDTTTNVETALVNGTDFTVTGAGNTSSSVTITPTSSIATGTNWVLYSDAGNAQGTTLTTAGEFPAKSLEYAFDKLAIGTQEADGKADRALKLPISDTASTEIPNATDRASKVLGFDANGAIQAVTASALTPEYKSVTDFGAVGDGVTDDTAALQGALDSNALVIMPAGKYRTTANLVIDPIRNRTCGFIGSVSPSIYPATQQTGGPAWDGTKECQIFYDGSTGSTTAVIAISAEAVGTEPSSTFENSIWGVRFENITFNGNDKAQYGFYAARLQQPYVANCVARQCEGDGWYINGSYSGMFVNIMARLNGGRGISIGAAAEDLGWTTNNKLNGVLFSNLWAYANGGDKLFDDTEVTDTAQAGASTTITLAAGASASDDIYNDWAIEITSGTGSGQYRTITDYNGTTKVATVLSAWDTNPDATSVYRIYATNKGCGVYFRPHRSCKIDRVTSELNDGAGIVFAPTSSGNVIHSVYTELNSDYEVGGTDAIDDSRAAKSYGIRFEGIASGVSYGNSVEHGFLSSEELWIQGIEPTSARVESAVEFKNLLGGSGVASAWDNYRLINCADEFIDNVTGTNPGSSWIVNSDREGNFTPTLEGSGTAGTGWGYDINIGSYTRIGKWVFFNLRIDLNTIGSGAAGSVLIKNLPFSIRNSNDSQTAFTISNVQNMTTSTVFASAAGVINTSEIAIYHKTAAAASESQTQISDISATTTFNINGFYRTA
jgi:hypothetical protein